MDIKNFEDLEELARILKNYRLDSIRVGDIELKKSLHDSLTTFAEIKPAQKEKTQEELYDELLFYSAGK